ncbi:methyltransferase domain-containing protein [Streptomyces sp. NPDC048606]|uniref:methyltransferase domain-containing protein n=1 Tax=Streptomyces sp. NPDC048606 TaxID=3154726 RepID=UPI0034302CF3
MIQLRAEERAAMRGLLDSVAEDLGAPPAPAWEAAYWAVPRHLFLPDTVWVGDDLEACSRRDAPEAWLRHAYADGSVVTQVNDGQGGDPGERWASCSASAPSIVFRMLDMLDVAPGHNVLEIGTGTGWNAGLLTHRIGPEHVTTIEVDQVLAARAAIRLKDIGLEPRTICGDGANGHQAGGPYDRILATCSVRSIPPAWIAQTKPGGVILAPWESPWFCYGLLRLTVDGHGAASGSFSPHSAFMLMRGQRTDLRIYRDVVRDDQVPLQSSAALSPWAVAGDDWAAQFAIGLQLGDVWWTWHDNPDVEGVASRLWLATTDATTWAAVDWDGRSEDRFTVWEYGPRRLWSEVEAAYRWWNLSGEPSPERFGMTITAGGEHRAWLDAPDRLIPQTG